MLIRPATMADNPAIADLHAANWRVVYRGILPDDYLDQRVVTDRQNDWRRRFTEPPANQHVIVAESPDGELAGFACGFGAHDPHLGTLLENLHVAHAYRQHGLGARLMAGIAGWSEQHYPGLGLHLYALQANAAARRFYERLGGVVTGRGDWQSPAGVPVPEVCYAWPRAASLTCR